MLKLPIHLSLIFCLFLFSLRPSVTGRMGSEGSQAGITASAAGRPHAESAPKNHVHYRTSFSNCEKKNLHRPMILACCALDVFGGPHASPRAFSTVVSKAVPSGRSPVLRI